MPYDADVFRTFMESVAMLALPEEVLARPGVSDRIRSAAEGREAIAPPGPSHDELLRELA
jgi:hypothetical protein